MAKTSTNIEKTYERSEDGENWEPISREAMIRILSGWYNDAHKVVDNMDIGHPVRTDFAFYRRKS
jgi:hypothetical protein